MNEWHLMLKIPVSVEVLMRTYRFLEASVSPPGGGSSSD